MSPAAPTPYVTLRRRAGAPRPSSPILVRALALLAALVLAMAPLAARADQTSQPRVAEAKYYQIVDQNGTVLAQSGQDDRFDPASITKVMTAMVALDSGMDLDATCTIDQQEYPGNAQLFGFRTGQQLTLRQLLSIMLVYSANDAADNVAIATAGSIDAFVDKMNAKAQEIGMTNTHFMNTHGLMQDDHYSTAADLVKMGKYALEHYPFIAQTVSKSSYSTSLNGYQLYLRSTDQLMDSYLGMIGIKTGTVETGCNFLGASERHGIRLYVCVLGCPSSSGRFGDSVRLMDWAYANCYQTATIPRTRLPIRVANWSLGFGLKALVFGSRDLSGLVHPGQDLDYAVYLPTTDLLVDQGQPIGTSTWSQGTRQVCYQTYTASRLQGDVPNVPIFALPLFVPLQA